VSDRSFHDAPDGAQPNKVMDRFFERQRRETLDRIATFQSRRRVRRVAVPLAAVLLAGAVLVGTGVFRPVRPNVAPVEDDWLFAWSLPGEVDEDPLAAFGPWVAAADADEGVESLLPPTPDEPPQDKWVLGNEIDGEV
jgi:hypothetical protein